MTLTCFKTFFQYSVVNLQLKNDVSGFTTWDQRTINKIFVLGIIFWVDFGAMLLQLPAKAGAHRNSMVQRIRE